MVPADNLRCKDQMKYYLNIEKIRLMCHTARETVCGQIFYNITCRDNEWDTSFNKKVDGSSQSSHLPSLFCQMLGRISTFISTY